MEELKNIFLDVVKNNYANFNGRARRREYWMFQLAVFIILVALSIVGAILGAMAEFLAGIVSLISGLVSLALLVPSIALSVRRVHDTNKAGWFIIIPIYNLILMLIEGDKGANQYGEDPKA